MLSVILSIVFASSAAQAFLSNAATPVCLEAGRALPIDNVRVLDFKAREKNQYTARARIAGKVITLPQVQNDHLHFSILIGPRAKDSIEVIYNIEFGSFPNVEIGDDIEVCGDFINAFAPAGGYPASPDGAIIHWVHFNPGTRPGSHDHGYVLFNNSDLAGFDQAPVPAWDGKIVRTGGKKIRRAY